MLRVLAAGLVVAMMLAAHGVANAAPSFQPGQMWTVKDSGIRIVVGRIDPFTDGKIAVSVSVFDVPCPPSMGCATTVVAHAPFDGETLAKSVDRLIGTDAKTAPEFEHGYANWQQARGGIFTVPVSQLPDLLFKAMQSGERHPS